MTKKVLRVLEADPSPDWAEAGKALGTEAGNFLGTESGPNGSWGAGVIGGIVGEAAGSIAGAAYGAAAAVGGALAGLASSTVNPVEYQPPGSGEGDPGPGKSGPQGGMSVNPNP